MIDRMIGRHGQGWGRGLENIIIIPPLNCNNFLDHRQKFMNLRRRRWGAAAGFDFEFRPVAEQHACNCFGTGPDGKLEEMLDLPGKSDLRHVAVWRMEGHASDEIAAKLDYSFATVERKLKTIRTIYREAGAWAE
jgi:ECF sigma factor